METSILTGARIKTRGAAGVFRAVVPRLPQERGSGYPAGCTRSRQGRRWDREGERKSLFCREDQVADGMCRIALPALS